MKIIQNQAEYIGESFSDYDFSELSLSETRFQRCNFKGSVMPSFSAFHCVFEDCDFSFARLNGSVHRSSLFLNCIFRAANLFSAEFLECKCTGSTFAGADLSALELHGGDYSYTIFNDSDLRGWNLRGLKFENAFLQNCRLEKADLRETNLRHAVLSGANLEYTDLRGADLTGVDFSSIRMKQTKIDLAQAILVAEAMGCVCL